MTTSYPYRTDDRLYAADLDWDLELNPGPNPPGSPNGGAGMFKYWVDTSGILPVLRQCVVPRAQNIYEPLEWMAIGTYDPGGRTFVFDSNFVQVPLQTVTLTGDVYGTGTTTIATELNLVNPTVGDYQGLTLDAKGRVTNAVDMHYAPLDSPVFIGFPEAPTPDPTDFSDRLATTEFVGHAFEASVTSFNTRTGAVVLSETDITDAGGAPIDSPDLTGTPTSTTPPPGDDSTRIATTAFVAATIASGSSTTVSSSPPASPSPGDGWFDSNSAELYIWFDDGTSAQWVIATNSSFLTAPKYLVGFSFTGGVLGASQLLGLHKFSKAVQFPANFATYAGHVSEAGATANATATTVLAVSIASAASPNTFSTIGTISFAAGSVTPTFATSGGTAINIGQGDVLRVIGPVTPDTTLANVYVTLVAAEA
jgi:hypothetical protein